jgi:hypothetical protein
MQVLLNSLPGKLKKRVKNEVEFRAKDAKTRVPALFKLIVGQALA